MEGDDQIIVLDTESIQHLTVAAHAMMKLEDGGRTPTAIAMLFGLATHHIREVLIKNEISTKEKLIAEWTKGAEDDRG